MSTYDSHQSVIRLTQNSVPVWFLGLLRIAKFSYDSTRDLSREVKVDLNDLGLWADQYYSLDGIEKNNNGYIFVQFAKNWERNLTDELNLKSTIDILDLAIAMGVSGSERGGIHSVDETLMAFDREYAFAGALLDKISHRPTNFPKTIQLKPANQSLREYLVDNHLDCPSDSKSWIGTSYASIASEMGRSPIFQPLYQRKSIKSVLLISDFSLQLEYGIGEDTQPITVQSEPTIRAETKPINKIFFGPPGTGKTHRIQTDLIRKYQSNSHELSNEQLMDLFVTRLTWAETVAIALLELGEASVSQLMDHELVLAKSRISSSKQVRRTLWTTILQHVPLENEDVNVSYRSNPLFWKHQNDTKPYFTLWENLDDNELACFRELLHESKSLVSHQESETTNHFAFVTFHQAFSYEDFVEGIKPILEEDSEGDLEYRIEPGVFKRICERARRNPDQPHAIFIDEINRGNVASIFGELITLIEPDKREGQANELRVTLPYSKKEFSIPSNLDIYGTMNTADRSVEALDTALRRRFEFSEIEPNWDVFDLRDYDGVNVGKMMRTINQRIEHLIDRDHCIGQSYFYQVDDFPSLQEVFSKNILPLLKEYFFGDFGKVGLILGAAFVHVRSERHTSFASFDHPDADLLQEKVVYDLQDPTDVEAGGYHAIYS